MLNTLAERLKLAMEGPPKVTGKSLADACGIKPPSVSDWLSGKTKTMEGSNLLAAAEFLKVRPRWLADGIGPMRGDTPVLPPEYQFKSGGYYLTECLGVGAGQSFQDDEGVILSLTQGNISLRNEWIEEARQFHTAMGTMIKHRVAEPAVTYLPEVQMDRMTKEMISLLSQLDIEGKRELLAHARGFVAGRRPQQDGHAPTVAGN